jgi:YidC/Oxa1 family membrane protein insertase
MDKKKILNNVLLFLVIFLGLNFVFKSCQGGTEGTSSLDQKPIGFITTDTSYSRNKVVTVEMKNNTEQDIVVPQDCPGEPFDVLHYENSEWVKTEASPELDCSKAVSYTLKPGEEAKIPYDNWNHALFSQMGRFKILFTLDGKTIETNEFTVEEEGIFSKLWKGVFYRPIYNTLIFLIAEIPGHSLGLAIIILTIIIRTILIIPSQKAMKSQRRMQELQPMIEKIKEKHKGDQAKISQEMMQIWKTHKVNPMGSCLPLLLQFPILIALFWVIKGGLNPDNTYLLYTQYDGFSFHNISSQFLGLDLLKANLYVLPLIVGLLQFIQMKMAMMKVPKKNEMAIANNMMTYMMPIMIAVFTASLPAGVGLYWGTSTLYGLVQQYFVNKSRPTTPGNNDDVKVRVIEKPSTPNT